MLGWRVLPGIDLGNFRLSPHGLFIAIGVLVGAILMARRAKRRGYPEERVWTVVEIAVLASIVGARVGYVAGHSEQFSSPLDWLKIWEGGLSLVGSLIGAFIAGALYIRHKGYDFYELADFAAPGLALGIAVGRIGDLIIGDHLGKATTGFWGWEYKGGELISPPPCNPAVYSYPTSDGCLGTGDVGVVVHQTALYDMVWSLVILGALTLIERRSQRRGTLFLSWGLMYAIGRIASDFARVEKRWLGLGLTGSQLASVAALLVALYGMTRLKPGPISDGAAAATYALESEEAAEVESEITPKEKVPETTPKEKVPETVPVEKVPETTEKVPETTEKVTETTEKVTETTETAESQPLWEEPGAVVPEPSPPPEEQQEPTDWEEPQPQVDALQEKLDLESAVAPSTPGHIEVTPGYLDEPMEIPTEEDEEDRT